MSPSFGPALPPISCFIEHEHPRSYAKTQFSDDYVTKPFGINELLARVRALYGAQPAPNSRNTCACLSASSGRKSNIVPIRILAKLKPDCESFHGEKAVLNSSPASSSEIRAGIGGRRDDADVMLSFDSSETSHSQPVVVPSATTIYRRMQCPRHNH
jgi:hypothetical protein